MSGQTVLPSAIDVYMFSKYLSLQETTTTTTTTSELATYMLKKSKSLDANSTDVNKLSTLTFSFAGILTIWNRGV